MAEAQTNTLGFFSVFAMACERKFVLMTRLSRIRRFFCSV